MPTFDLQGHRGARGLRPENTLPSFEAAFDACVASVETDVHLTQDGIPVLIHDPCLNPRIFGAPPLDVSSITLDQLRATPAVGNPNPERFSNQTPSLSPLAAVYADHMGIHPYAVPQLSDLFAFAQLYAGDEGRRAGKTDIQRQRAQAVCFDLELKNVPFFSTTIGDKCESAVLLAIRTAGVVDRTRVRSFDHRSVRRMRREEPRLTASVLIAEAALVSPEKLARSADAQVYCPDYRFLDEQQVVQCHAEGIRVIPWTVNAPQDWQRLLDLGVDGITTDYPDQLALTLRQRNIPF
jgi:glycerophosphoryl diester phosphodiesterase